jgi:hypothetical protein
MYDEDSGCTMIILLRAIPLGENFCSPFIAFLAVFALAVESRQHYKIINFVDNFFAAMGVSIMFLEKFCL